MNTSFGPIALNRIQPCKLGLTHYDLAETLVKEICKKIFSS